MEDILASIRRILNEDEAAPPAEAPADEKAPPEDDVLVLDQSMMVSAEPEPDPLPELPPPAVVEVQPPVQVVPAAKPPPVPEPPPEPMAPMPELMAPETAAAAASSLGSLVRTLTAGRTTQVYSGGPTLEDLVRAELRPLLAEWLDSHLPPIVERLVRIEIERVVGRSVP